MVDVLNHRDEEVDASGGKRSSQPVIVRDDA